MLARCSTSAADAPGICTKTSSMGTTICGSSSRGVRRMAKPPSSSENRMNSGVSFELMNCPAIAPAIFIGVLISAITAPQPVCRSSRDQPVAARSGRHSAVQIELPPHRPKLAPSVT